MRNFNDLYLKATHWRAVIFTWLMRRSFDSLGEGTLIFPPIKVYNPHRIRIGKGSQVYTGCWLNAVTQWAGREYAGKISIGDHTILAQGVQISALESVSVGNFVGISQHSVIVDHLHGYQDVNQNILFAPLTEAKPVVIEDDVFIGVNCMIGPGVRIGRHSFVGSNSVVVKDVPPYTMAIGNPARVIRRYNEGTGQWERVAGDG